MSYDRAKAKQDLQNQTKSSYQSKDSGGFTSIMKEGLPLWKCSEGKHKVDIIPFEVGKNHPSLSAGRGAYMLEIFTHYGIGANSDTFLCLNKMYKEDCPVCNYRKQLMDDGTADDAVLKALKPKRNTLYNVVVYDTPDETTKGVQIWNISHFFMESKLMAIAEDESGELIYFADPDDGKRIRFERKGNGAGNTNYIGHKFDNRDYKISDKILDSTFKLDECVKKPSYEEVERALLGRSATVNTEDEDEAPIPPRGRTRASAPDVPEKVEEEPVNPDAIKNMSRKELKALIAETGIPVDIDSFEEKEDLQNEIIDKLFGAANTGSDKACPHKGGTFGKSFDTYDGCTDCDLFWECSTECDVMKKNKKK